MASITIDFKNEAIYNVAYDTLRKDYNYKINPNSIYGDFGVCGYKAIALYEEYFRNRGEFMKAIGDLTNLGGEVRK